jgi:hypothetical protein
LLESGPYRGIRFDTPTTRAAILAQAQGHNTYTYQGVDFVFENLPQYDKLSTHAEMSEEQESSLLEAEVDRLVDHIQRHDLKESLLDLGTQLGSTVTEAALEDIATVVDRIVTNLNLCVFDMAIMLVRELAPHRHSSQTTRSIVEWALKKARSSRYVLLRDYIGSDTIVPRSPKDPQIIEDQSKLYLTLLEYFTSLLGRFLMNTAEGDIWVRKCLSVLARMTAKLKQLGYDAKAHAEQSMRHAEVLVSDLECEQEVEKSAGGKLEALKCGETFVDLMDVISPTTVYHLEQVRIRTHLHSILSRLLDGFSQRKRVSHWRPYSFELNTIIRAARSPGEDEEKPLWLISEDRHNGIAISDTTTTLRNYPGCQLLLHNLLAIRRRSPDEFLAGLPAESQELPDPINVTLQWSFSCKSDPVAGFLDDANDVMSSSQQRLHHDIRRPDDYVSVLAPLLLSSSSIARETSRLVSTVQSSRGTQNGIKLYKQQNLEAMFTFKCDGGQVEQASHRDDVMPLSRFREIGWHSDPSQGEDDGNISVRTIGSTFRSKPSLSSTSSASDEETTRSTSQKECLGIQIQEAEVMYLRHQKSMKSWKISDKAVVVRCNGFIFVAVASFLSLITIGLAIFFKFGKKLVGVDRSNILILLWAVAVFGIGMSKSWYTKDWSWYDLMHRQLPCKSVRELSRKTMVDEQVIIMYLLRNDISKFHTTGEHNSVFRRTALVGHDGFAIDCPLKLSTLLACGFLVFMVQREDGTHLICIGGKKRNESVRCGSNTRVLACRAPKPSSQEKSKSSQENSKVELHFKEEAFSWERSYGLYTNASMLFG